MGWTSYNAPGKTNKECCLDEVKNYKGRCLKTVMKGSSFYALMETPDKTQWVLKLLTARKNNEFYFKDIQCSPDEIEDVPLSILKAFVPSTVNDVIWLSKCIDCNKKMTERKNSLSFGSIWKIKTPYDMEFSNGHKIIKNSEIYIKIDVLNKSSKRKNKAFMVYNKTENGRFERSCYRIRESDFNSSIKEKIEA